MLGVVGVVAIERDFTQPGAPYVVTEAGLALVRQWTADGANHTRIAHALGITRDAWRAIRARQPEVDETYEAGRGVLFHEMTHIVVRKARSGDHQSLLAAFAVLKMFYGLRDQGPSDVAGSQVVNVQITLPPAMSPEEYARSLAIDATATSAQPAAEPASESAA